MVSAPQRREGVTFLKTWGSSERRSCELAEIGRSSFRYEPNPRDDGELAGRLQIISNKHKRYGYRRAWALLRREAKIVNHKRVFRVWKKEGLSLPRRRPKKRRKGIGDVPCRAESPRHVWTYDFIHDATQSGRKLKMLTVVDEFTRFCPAIEPETSIKAQKVIEILRRLFEKHGAPTFIRSDNGPEFIAATLKKWLEKSGAKTIYIDPGKPWQNPYGESFNGKFRDECLNMELFNNINHAKVVIEMWRREYNENRPHSSLGYMTPAEFAAMCNERISGLSLSGECGCLKGKRQSVSPCPSALSPASALGSLPSVALSSAQANESLT